MTGWLARQAEREIAHPQAGPSHGWRPQRFGQGHARDVRDPLIEPLWEGLRVLARVERGGLDLSDEDGDVLNEAIEGVEPVAGELAGAVRVEHAIVDGYLTHMVAHGSVGAFDDAVRAPSSLEMAEQLLIGGRARRSEAVAALRPAGSEDAPLAFVAVDLLALDGEPLLDIPLLERKRLLESALVETELVRLGSYVRPPVDSWLTSWRALGFRSLAYKAANSRYRPGRVNDGWAIARIPQR